MRKANPKLTTRSRAAPKSLINPTKLPNIYSLQVRGACMMPEIADGAGVIGDKTQPYKVGDLVIVWFRPRVCRPGGPQCLVKQLAMGHGHFRLPFKLAKGSEVSPVIQLAQTNPPRHHIYELKDILAIHKVVGQSKITNGNVSLPGAT